MNDQRAEILSLLVGSAYSNVLGLLEALQENDLDSFPRPGERIFTLPEQAVHLMQVTRFTMNVVLDQLCIEEHPLHAVFHDVAEMQPSGEKRATLSSMNLAGATSGLKGVSSMRELRDQLETTFHWVATKMDLISDDQWDQKISHPLVELRENCILFLYRMLVVHTHHHFGEMVMLAKLAGRGDAVPFAIGKVD